MRLTLAALVACTTLLAGCGDDEPTYQGSFDQVEPTSTVSGPSATANGGTGVADCATDAVATFPGDGDVALQDGKAVALGGPAYTIYAGDFEIPSEGIAISGAVAGPGQHLATVAITVFNAEGELPELPIGEPIAYSEELGGLTFIVILDDAGTQSGNNAGATGTVTVTGVDEGSICVDVDYRDEKISVTGTIAAEIV